MNVFAWIRLLLLSLIFPVKKKSNVWFDFSFWYSINRHNARWRCTESEPDARTCPLDERGYGRAYDIQFAPWSNSRHALHVERWSRCKFPMDIFILTVIKWEKTTSALTMCARVMYTSLKNYFQISNVWHRISVYSSSIWNGMSFAFYHLCARIVWTLLYTRTICIHKYIVSILLLFGIRLLLIAFEIHESGFVLLCWTPRMSEWASERTKNELQYEMTVQSISIE